MFRKEHLVFVKQVTSWAPKFNAYLNKAQVMNDHFDNENENTIMKRKETWIPVIALGQNSSVSQFLHLKILNHNTIF